MTISSRLNNNNEVQTFTKYIKQLFILFIIICNKLFMTHTNNNCMKNLFVESIIK